jgi:hypothetical protein
MRTIEDMANELGLEVKKVFDNAGNELVNYGYSEKIEDGEYCILTIDGEKIWVAAENGEIEIVE